MGHKELLAALNTLKVQTGSLACLGCGYEHGCSVHGCAILREAVEQLKGRHPDDGEPLVLEQLREMVDKPAYLYIYDTALDSGWEIIKAVTKDKIIFRGWNTVYVSISSLGKCFDLYAYPPDHLDREAWEPCWMCSISSGEPAKHLILPETCNGEAKYCPECGRPITPEAWAELEKRLRG